MDPEKARAGLLAISRGFKILADAIPATNASELSDAERDLGMAREWGTRGLNKQEAADLCAKWGYPGQKISAWVRGDWAEIREDGRRYLTAKSLEWLEKEDAA